MDAAHIKKLIRDIPDFPEEGFVFKDITPLLGDRDAFHAVCDAIADHYADAGVTKVAGIEARGFIFAAPVAYRLGAGFVPIRKEGKLPHEVEAQRYDLEYGTDLLEVHRDAVVPGDKVAIIDDVLATGGTSSAAVRLMSRLGAEVAGISVVVELTFLAGRDKITDVDFMALVAYDSP